MKQKVIMLKGLPASGKSTWAKEFVSKNPTFKRINNDELRMMFDNSVFSKGKEKFITRIRQVLICEALLNDYSVIVDNTNFNPKCEEEVKEIIDTLAQFSKRAEFEIKEFDTPLEDCIKRDEVRAKSVGAKVIRGMYDKYLKPSKPIIEYDESLFDAIIVDIDGTLAHMNGRSPYDWSRVGEDTLDETVYDLVKMYEQAGYKIIVVTGRDGECAGDTKAWLYKHGIFYSEFYIRPAGNTESDEIIKRRIYDEHINGKYNVKAVIDDRDRVVRMWRELGLKVLQVEDGNF